MKYKISFDFKIIDVFLLMGISLIWIIVTTLIFSFIAGAIGNYFIASLLVPLIILTSSIAIIIHIVKYICEGITIYPVIKDGQELNKEIQINKPL